jgi:hypothetical protein
VDHRPCEKCKLTEVSGGQSGFILAAFDQAHQRPERLFCSFSRIRSLVLGNGCVEHDGEVLGPAQSKFHIRQAGALQPTNTAPLVSDSFQHRCIQFPESLGRHPRQEIFSIQKVSIRRVVGDACASCYFPQGEAGWPDFGDQLNRRFQ